MARAIVAGSTSQSLQVKVLNATKTDGSGLTSLVASTTSLIAYYTRSNAAPSAISLIALSHMTDAYVSGGFLASDVTSGLYRLDVPDASVAYAAGVPSVVVSLNGAANMSQTDKEVELVRDRFGIAGYGTFGAASNATTGVVPSADSLMWAVGYTCYVPGIGARQVTYYSASTATFATAFPSTISSQPYVLYVSSPSEAVVPVWSNVSQINSAVVTGSGTTASPWGGQ